MRPGFAREETQLMTRLILGADAGSGPVTLHTEIWDSRTFGVGPGSFAGTGETNVVEPVALNISTNLGSIAGPETLTRVTLGRMIINLGSRRIIAADDYRNTTNGYTGVRLDFTNGLSMDATFIAVLPQYRLPDTPDGLKSQRWELDRERWGLRLWGGIATHRDALGRMGLEGSFFRLDEEDTPYIATRDRHLSTLDARLFLPRTPGLWDAELEGAWQWGQTRAGLSNALPEQVVAAGFVHADVGYSLIKAWKPRVSIQFDYASGDRPGGRYTRFDSLFGMRRADFSPGSLLSTLYRTNLVAPALRVEVEPSQATDAFATARAVWADSATDVLSQTGVRDPLGRYGRFGGWEFDGRLRHWLIARRLRTELNATFYLRRGLLASPAALPGRTTGYGSFSLIAPF